MQTATQAPSTLRALALLLACSACAVGEPLVDRAPPAIELEGPPPPDCFMPSMLCDVEIRPPDAPVAAHALALSSCASAEPDAPLEEEGDASPDCEPPDAGADWRDRDVRLTAREPREVVISGVSVGDVRVHLDGPVTVIVRDVSSFAGVQFSSTSPDAQLILDGIEGRHVMIGDATTPFQGHVEARLARIDHLSVVTASLLLDSSMITQSFVSAAFLSSGDGFLREVVLEAGEALFAPSRLEKVRIARCGTLSFFGGKLLNTVVPRCDGETTRLHNVEVRGGIVDGSVRADWGKLVGVQLGRHDESEFELWGASVGSMFCDAAKSVRSTYGIRCSHCTEKAFGDPDDVCNLMEPAEGLERLNFCEVLDLKTECPPLLPDRLRPIADYWL